MIPGWIKWLHVVGIVVYAGGFLALTRLLGHAVRFQAEESRADAYRIFKRMHKFVDWGGLGIILATGFWMLVVDPAGVKYMKQGYFHMKLTCILVLVVCDIVLSRKLFALEGAGTQPSATIFRILHGVSALAVIGTLAAMFIIRTTT